MEGDPGAPRERADSIAACVVVLGPWVGTVADTCVAHVPVFANLSADDQQRVAQVARPTRLRAGESAYRAGEDLSQLLVLHAGRLKIVRLSADGSEQLVRVLGPGEFTGETSVFSARRPDDDAVALDDCQLCAFRHVDLERLIQRNPGIGLRILAAMSERLAETESRLHALTSRGVERRLAGYLLGLRGSWRDGALVLTLPLAKKDVASLLDTTPESLSRALRSLADKDLISIGAGRALTVTRPDRLQRLADET